MRVVSVPGRLVRDPVSRRVIDEAGINVSPFDPTWTRLIADGDVEIVPEEIEAMLAPVLDGEGTPLNPPAGDLAADIAAPGTVGPGPDQAAAKEADPEEIAE